MGWSGQDWHGTATPLKPRDKKCSQDASLCEQEKQETRVCHDSMKVLEVRTLFAVRRAFHHVKQGVDGEKPPCSRQDKKRRAPTEGSCHQSSKSRSNWSRQKVYAFLKCRGLGSQQMPTPSYTLAMGPGSWGLDGIWWDQKAPKPKHTYYILEMNPWVIKQITRKHVHVATQNSKIRTATPQDPCQNFPIVTDFTCTLAQCLEQQLS